jgi:hypothetical protein
MATKLLLDTCELTGKECRFCSVEACYRPYTEIKPENGIYKPVAQGNKRCEIGQMCNTVEIGTNPWISEMNTCPVMWSVARYGKIPVGEKKKRTKPKTIKAKVVK